MFVKLRGKIEVRSKLATAEYTAWQETICRNIQLAEAPGIEDNMFVKPADCIKFAYTSLGLTV